MNDQEISKSPLIIELTSILRRAEIEGLTGEVWEELFYLIERLEDALLEKQP